jgi:hypothetical protein
MVIDIVLCSVVLLLFLLGVLRGFFKSVPGIVRSAIALCLAICTSSAIIESFTAPYFKSVVTLKIEEYIITSCPDITSETATAVLPTLLIMISNLFGITIPTDGAATAEEFIHNISVLLGDPVGTVIAMIVTYLALFIVFSILIKILLKICDNAFSYGILGWINRILGGITGLAIGCVIACSAANVLAQFFPQYTVGCGAPYYFFLNFNPLAFVLSF